MAESAAADSASASNTVQIVENTNNGHDLTPLAPLTMEPSATISATGDAQTIYINDKIHYQTFEGVGAAMTNSSAWELMHQLPRAIGNQVLKDMFSPQGLHINMVRVPIGASDFNVAGKIFSEDDVPPGHTDPKLRHFNLRHDKYTIQALHTALQYNPGLKIIAMPWSPPAWMKTDDSLVNSTGRSTLKAGYIYDYAKYLDRYALGMKKHGIPIYAMGILNEPGVISNYPSSGLLPGQEAKVIRDLRPMLRKQGLNTKLYVNDASWRNHLGWSTEALKASGASGTFWHCYGGSPVLMSTMHKRFQHQDEGISECALNLVGEPSAQLAIEGLNNWASFVLNWNLALDSSGGPKTPNDANCMGCTGEVTVNSDNTGVTYSRQYYDMGIGHYIQPGARRIFSTRGVTYDPNSLAESPGVDDTAFQNPDGSKVLVTYNNTNSPRQVTVQQNGRSFSFTAPGNATDILTWRP